MRVVASAALALALVAVPVLAVGPSLERAPAPRFEVRDVTGKPLALAALLERGPVVLDFWATWCKPCLQSLPEMEALQQKYGPRGATVVGVSVDSPRNFAKVRPFAQRLGLTFPVVLDSDERLQQLFQVRGIPTTIVIAKDGRIVRAKQGYLPGDVAAIEAALDTLSAPASATP